MLFLPALDYALFDPSAPSSFKRVEIDNYILIAFVTLVLYDHLITLDIEVESIWSLNWRLPKYLFLISRYILPPMFLLMAVGTTVYPILPSFCTFIVHFHRITQAISFVVAELVLLIRVSALYGHSKIMLRILVVLFICQLVAVIILTVFVTKAYTAYSYYKFLPGCEVYHFWNRQYIWWIPFTCFDGLLFILALVKTLSYWKNSFPMIRLLARDSIFYFAITCSTLVTDMIVTENSGTWPTLIPAEWIACIAVSRMMMNIQGLCLDDPHSTRGIEFSTIQLRNHYAEAECNSRMPASAPSRGL